MIAGLCFGHKPSVKYALVNQILIYQSYLKRSFHNNRIIFLLGCRGRIRTVDHQVMSLLSYLCSTLQCRGGENEHAPAQRTVVDSFDHSLALVQYMRFELIPACNYIHAVLPYITNIVNIKLRCMYTRGVAL